LYLIRFIFFVLVVAYTARRGQALGLFQYVNNAELRLKAEQTAAENRLKEAQTETEQRLVNALSGINDKIDGLSKDLKKVQEDLKKVQEMQLYTGFFLIIVALSGAFGSPVLSDAIGVLLKFLKFF
jgi:conjugal transfer/entry exclusion protein